MSITRDEIADVCRAHDKFMIEAREWLRSPPVSEPDDPGIVYKEYDNNEPAPAPQPNTDWSAWEAWLAGHLANARVEVLDDLAKAMGEVVSVLRREWRDAIEQAKQKDDARIARLEGKVDTLLSLITKDQSSSRRARPRWQHSQRTAAGIKLKDFAARSSRVPVAERFPASNMEN